MTATAIHQATTAPTCWTVDPADTCVEFSVRTFGGLMTVHGGVDRFDGAHEIGTDGTTIDLTIDPDSLDTGPTTRDEHLRSGDFFDTERHPTRSGSKVVPLEFDATVQQAAETLEMSSDTRFETLKNRVVGNGFGIRIARTTSPGSRAVFR